MDTTEHLEVLKLTDFFSIIYLLDWKWRETATPALFRLNKTR